MSSRYVSDMRVKVTSNRLLLPTRMLSLSAVNRAAEDDTFDTLLNPTVVVLKSFPRRPKLMIEVRNLQHYQTNCLLARSMFSFLRTRFALNIIYRQGTQWLLTEFCGLQEVLSLISIRCELHLSDIYRRITFSEESTTLTEVGE